MSRLLTSTEATSLAQMWDTANEAVVASAFPVGARVRHRITDELGTVIPRTWDQAGDRVCVRYDSDGFEGHTQASKLRLEP